MALPAFYSFSFLLVQLFTRSDLLAVGPLCGARGQDVSLHCRKMAACHLAAVVRGTDTGQERKKGHSGRPGAHMAE